MNMDVLLIKDVERLGKRGNHVTVKSGYARNHLLPLGYAVPLTEENRRMVERRRLQWLAEEAKLLEDLRELAGHLAKLDITIVQKSADSGHLYGSVDERAIAAAVKAEGIDLDPKVVRLEHHLKEVGDYEVIMRLHEEVVVTLPIKVRAEGREDWLPSDEVEAKPAAEDAEVETPSDPAD
jgi:large subunit ribosomal protein L9